MLIIFPIFASLALASPAKDGGDNTDANPAQDNDAERFCFIFKDGKTTSYRVNATTLFGDDAKSWTIQKAEDFPYKDFVYPQVKSAPPVRPEDLSAKMVYSKKVDWDSHTPGYGLVAVPVLDSPRPESGDVNVDKIPNHKVIWTGIKWTILPHNQGDAWLSCIDNIIYGPQSGDTGHNSGNR
ncbi:hypothetical protein PYCC9005_003449 [Savitreella phatthalungensis]